MSAGSVSTPNQRTAVFSRSPVPARPPVTWHRKTWSTKEHTSPLG
ncbi:Protein of unknown function [Propionibacterium freudenreichii]|nr:Protein of unknown function [Propionibacterium freudenreichii]